MFIIKVMRPDGYTAFCAEIYDVRYEANGVVILDIIPKASAQSEVYPVRVVPSPSYQATVYIANSTGNIIETIQLAQLSEEKAS